MDVSVLCWRDVALRKMRSRGVGGMDVEVLAAYRGMPIDTVTWGTVDREAIAVKPGQKVWIDCGRNVAVTLVGPQTAYQVLDAILRAVRGDSPRKVYTAEEKARVTDCRRCPLQGFAGLLDLGTHTPPPCPVPQYRVLWSHFFCHTGVACAPTYPYAKDARRVVTHEFFLPENAINFLQPQPQHQHQQQEEVEQQQLEERIPSNAGLGRPPMGSKLLAWRDGRQQQQQSQGSPHQQQHQQRGRRPRQEQQQQQESTQRRWTLPSALAALLSVK